MPTNPPGHSEQAGHSTPPGPPSKSKRLDLKGEGFPKVTWEQGKCAEPLLTLVAYAVTQATKTIDWYFHGRKKRRALCTWFRLSAILLTAIAGMLPLWNDIFVSRSNPVVQTYPLPVAAAGNALPTNGVPGNPTPVATPTTTVTTPAVSVSFTRPSPVHPLWSAVALSLAATLVLLDRFAGGTTGWVRYVLTAQEVTRALETFQLEVERQRVGWGSPEPNQDQAKIMIATIQQFCTQVRGLVADETKAWAAEFAEVLKQIDEQMKTAAQANQRSALQVTVTNGDQCTGPWNLTVDQRSAEQRIGREAAVEVLPGIHTVAITGTIGGKAMSVQQPVKVAAGEIGRVTLTLA